MTKLLLTAFLLTFSVSFNCLAIFSKDIFTDQTYSFFPINPDTVFIKFENNTYWWTYHNDVLEMNKDTKRFFSKIKRNFHKITSYKSFYEIDSLKFNFLQGLKKKDLIKLIGAPDEIIASNEVYFIYYIGRYRKRDCCWINVFFNSQSKVSSSFEECN